MLATLVARTYGQAAFGRAMGLVAVVTSAGGAGAYVIGFLHDRFGTFELALRVAIVCLLPFSVTILLALRARPQEMQGDLIKENAPGAQLTKR